MTLRLDLYLEPCRGKLGGSKAYVSTSDRDRTCRRKDSLAWAHACQCAVLEKRRSESYLLQSIMVTFAGGTAPAAWLTATVLIAVTDLIGR
eukprot:321749-Rhodomonas_salina.1